MQSKAWQRAFSVDRSTRRLALFQIPETASAESQARFATSLIFVMSRSAATLCRRNRIITPFSSSLSFYFIAK